MFRERSRGGRVGMKSGDCVGGKLVTAAVGTSGLNLLRIKFQNLSL